MSRLPASPGSLPGRVPKGTPRSLAAPTGAIALGASPAQALRAKLAVSRPQRKARIVRAAGKFKLSLGYSPINLEVYIQAFDGAMAGMIGGRIISNTTLGGYDEQAVAASVWAQEFDTLWDSATAIVEVQAEQILLQSYAVWEGRSAASLTASNAQQTIAAIITAIEDAATVLIVSGITSPPWNGGGGSAVQSGYAASSAPEVLGTGLASILSAPLSLTLTSATPNVVLNGAVNVAVGGGFAGNPSLRIELFQNGAMVFTDTYFYPATGGSYSFTYRALATLSNPNTFDIQMQVSATSGNPTAFGRLTAIATP